MPVNRSRTVELASTSAASSATSRATERTVSRSGSAARPAPPMVMPPRSSRCPVVALLSRRRDSRSRWAWALASPKPTSLASAPMSATWLWSRSSSRRSARTHRSCSVTVIPAASSTAMAKASACPTAVSPLIRSASSMAVRRSAPFEELLDAPVDEPEPGLHPQDGLPDDGEPEVARLDQTGVNRSDRDLVDAFALDFEEGEGAHVERRSAGRGRRLGASRTSPAASGRDGSAGRAAGGPRG